MATNVYSGREALIGLAATSSGTITRFGALENWEITAEAATIPVAHRDTSGYVQRLPGTVAKSLRCSCFWLSTAASVNEQDTLRSALDGRTRKWFSITNSTAAGGQTFTGYGYVAGWTGGAAGENAAQLHGFSVDFDGKVTEA